MGTNYYHRTNICGHCNRFDERHIGKRSMGWEFSFRGYNSNPDDPSSPDQHIHSWETWKEILKEGKIFDEYRTEIDFDEFVAIVERSKGKLSHYAEIMKSPHYGSAFLQDDWRDEEGWSFSAREFC